MLRTCVHEIIILLAIPHSTEDFKFHNKNGTTSRERHCKIKNSYKKEKEMNEHWG